ncbi:hypothetical protein GCM10023335_56540 [Streptomyces siamensis]|uniref:Uncharacterized protein n=1 Tax=Streptomyces siamensis TaxID=1274986 RepID=A0ABP9JAL0_9ACTN
MCAKEAVSWSGTSRKGDRPRFKIRFDVAVGAVAHESQQLGARRLRIRVPPPARLIGPQPP